MEVEAAVNRLEALVEKVDLDINYAIQRLANEFSETFKDELQDEINPVRLTERLQIVKEEFKMLTSEAKEIEAEQKKMTNILCTAIAEPMKTIDQVQVKAGLQLSHDPEEVILLLNKQCDNADKENRLQCTSAEETSKGTNWALLRAESKGFVPVAQDEFVDLSDLVRGRSKLEDVNKVYETLYEYFKKNPKSCLTLKDMTNMGLRVTGATGGSKLKVLRTLKIIQINKQGSVKMC